MCKLQYLQYVVRALPGSLGGAGVIIHVASNQNHPRNTPTKRVGVGAKYGVRIKMFRIVVCLGKLVNIPCGCGRVPLGFTATQLGGAPKAERSRTTFITMVDADRGPGIADFVSP